MSEQGIHERRRELHKRKLHDILQKLAEIAPSNSSKYISIVCNHPKVEPCSGLEKRELH